MGMDIGGGMIVGAWAEEISEPDDYEDEFCEWAEGEGLDCYSMYYDATEEGQFCGFTVDDVDTKDLNLEWLDKVKQLGTKFEELTGVPAKLVGMQDVW